MFHTDTRGSFLRSKETLSSENSCSIDTGVCSSQLEEVCKLDESPASLQIKKSSADTICGEVTPSRENNAEAEAIVVKTEGVVEESEGAFMKNICTEMQRLSASSQLIEVLLLKTTPRTP